MTPRGLAAAGRPKSDQGKCGRDWQGPSDDECLDDLLVVACVRRTFTQPHRWHVGVVETGTDAGFDIVYWLHGTGDLYDFRTNKVYRRQFAGAGGSGG